MAYGIPTGLPGSTYQRDYGPSSGGEPDQDEIRRALRQGYGREPTEDEVQEVVAGLRSQSRTAPYEPTPTGLPSHDFGADEGPPDYTPVTGWRPRRRDTPISTDTPLGPPEPPISRRQPVAMGLPLLPDASLGTGAERLGREASYGPRIQELGQESRTGPFEALGAAAEYMSAPATTAAGLMTVFPGQEEQAASTIRRQAEAAGGGLGGLLQGARDYQRTRPPLERLVTEAAADPLNLVGIGLERQALAGAARLGSGAARRGLRAAGEAMAQVGRTAEALPGSSGEVVGAFPEAVGRGALRGAADDVLKGAADVPEPPIIPLRPDGKPQGWVDSIRRAPDTPQSLQEALTADPGSYYTPLSNRAAAAAARELVERDPAAARALVTDLGREPDALTSAVGQILTRRALQRAEGLSGSERLAALDEALDLTEKLADRHTKAGQFNQAASMWGRMTPEGWLRKAQTVVRQAQEAGHTGAKLTPEKADSIVKKATELQRVGEELAKGPQPKPSFAASIAEALEQGKRMLYGRFRAELDKTLKDPFITIYANPLPVPGRNRGFQMDPADVARFQSQAVQVQAIADPVARSAAQKALKKEIDAFVRSQARMPQRVPASSREADLLTAELMRDVAELVPVGLGRKVATFQTMMQLLNPKTMIRNLGGNLLMGAAENVNRLLATGLDIPVSLVTGNRSVTVPNLLQQARGFARGAREGTEEALRGVNIQQLPGQFDLPTGQSARTFGDTPVLSQMETALNLSLRVPDRAFYQASYDDALLAQAWLTARNEGLRGTALGQRKAQLVATPTLEMQKQARADALFATFQDESRAATAFTGLKKVLNLGADFGVGDLVLKYPRTPANLLVRAAEYSPLGFFESLAHLTRLAIARGKSVGAQKAFVESMGRAALGSAGLTGTGYMLAELGLLTGRSSRDKDVRAQENLQGIGQYRFNATGLERFVLSGFDTAAAKRREGDTWVTYNWLQPFAVPLAIGAQLARPEKKTPKVYLRGPAGVWDQIADIAEDYGGTVLDVMEVGLDTLAQQGMVQGVRRVFGAQNVGDAVVQVLKDAPASFVPTLLSQINQVTDNVARDVTDDDFAREAMNQVLAKIPILAASLPPSVDTWGNERDRYHQDGNNPFNVFVNPSFVSQYFPKPEAEMLLALQEATGATEHFPRVAPRELSITVEGVTTRYVLTADQQREYQVHLGQMTREAFSALAASPDFRSEPPGEQIAMLSRVLTRLNAQAVERLREKYQEADGGVHGLPAPKAKKLTAGQTLNEKNAVEWYRDHKKLKEYETMDDRVASGNPLYAAARAAVEATVPGSRERAVAEAYVVYDQFQKAVNAERLRLRSANNYELDAIGVKWGMWQPLEAPNDRREPPPNPGRLPRELKPVPPFLLPRRQPAPAAAGAR